MKTVPLFDSIFESSLFSDRQARTFRSGRVLYQLFRFAGKGVNPAAVWLDAGVAVIDCINAFLRYQQAREITEQLLAQKQALEVQILNFDKKLAIEQELLKADQQHRIQLFDNLLKNDQQASLRLVKAIRANRRNLDALLAQLNTLRKQSTYRTPEFSALVKATDTFMQAQLAFLVAAFDEPNDR